MTRDEFTEQLLTLSHNEDDVIPNIMEAISTSNETQIEDFTI